ncbi:hypothetical protein ACW6MR_004741 [Escherichia coli]|nr:MULTISPECIES: hypothetical protein [Enterobacteriaceae]
MDEKQLQALANELAKNLKIPEDLSQHDKGQCGTTYPTLRF